MISDILVNGTPLDLGGVEYRVTVSHGRNDITANPQPSDASLTLIGLPDIPIDVSDVISIEAYGVARFTGRVSDVQLTHDYNPTGPSIGSPPTAYFARLDVTVMGNLALLGLSMVGATGYAKELLEDRVNNILTDAGVIYQANVDPLMTQEALAAQLGGYSAMDLLTSLGTETGGTLCDLPDGNILWESYSRRGFGYNPSHWYDIPVTYTYPDIPYVWSDIFDRTDTAPLTVALPAAATVWSPVWRKSNSTIINEITVVYGSNGNAEKTDSDPASIITHGRRADTITTQLHEAADAQTRAGDIIRAQSEPRYAMQNVSVIMDRLSAPQLADVLALISGSKVGIDDVPQPAPIEDYIGVVEGWSEVYTPGQHVLTLSLSDPRFSYQVVRWDEISTTIRYNTIDPTVQWYNVVVPSDLLP